MLVTSPLPPVCHFFSTAARIWVLFRPKLTLNLKLSQDSTCTVITAKLISVKYFHKYNTFNSSPNNIIMLKSAYAKKKTLYHNTIYPHKNVCH